MIGMFENEDFSPEYGTTDVSEKYSVYSKNSSSREIDKKQRRLPNGLLQGTKLSLTRKALRNRGGWSPSIRLLIWGRERIGVVVFLMELGEDRDKEVKSLERTEGGNNNSFNSLKISSLCPLWLYFDNIKSIERSKYHG